MGEWRHLPGGVFVNVRSARELTEPAFAARDVTAEKDTQTLAAVLLAMSLDDSSAAFRKSTLKRAKLAGLRRNAAVVFENTPTSPL